MGDACYGDAGGSVWKWMMQRFEHHHHQHHVMIITVIIIIITMEVDDAKVLTSSSLSSTL